MRIIESDIIEKEVERLCIDANRELSHDMECVLCRCKEKESSPLGKEVFSKIEENLKAAKEMDIPICQDTGMAVVFLEIGSKVLVSGKNIEDAVNCGVENGYVKGCLRLSIVKDPLRRENTGTNAPAIIHTKIVDGDKIKITVCPKGFGSENMSKIKMFNPSSELEEIESFVVEVVREAGSKPCPPIVVGVGIGGNFEYAAYLSKKALIREAGKENPDKFWADFEKRTLSKINALGIGPQGFGGDITALSVHSEVFPTHIAGLPVAVNIGCHVNRHKTVII